MFKRKYDIYLLLFFVDLLGAITVSNVFNATEILFDPQLQEVLDFKSKLPNDDLVITREDFDPKSTPLKIDLYDEFFIKNPIKSIRALNASNEVCSTY